MLLGITIVMFPVMVMYKNDKEQGILGLEKTSYKTMFNKVTLGNLGGAQTQCVTKRLEREKDTSVPDRSIDLKLSCPNGKRAKIVQKSEKFGPKHGHVFKAGIMADGIEQRDYCSNELILKENQMKSATKPDGIIDCDPFFDHEAIHSDLEKCKDMHKKDGICLVSLVDK